MTEELTKNDRVDAIYSIQDVIQKMPQVDCPVTHHHFHKGYGREMFIPAGTMLTGKVHKFTSLNILLEGDISLMTPDGSNRVQAPYIVVSSEGTKRLGYAHTDCRWLCVHGTEETELDKIEAEVITDDEEFRLTETAKNKELKE